MSASPSAPWPTRRGAPSGPRRALRGGPATAETFAAAADAELAEARPLRDNGYKVAVARELIARTLADLAAAS